MPEPKKQKYDLILQGLIEALKARDGDERVSLLHAKLRERVKEGMHREAIIQMLAEETILNRTKFLYLYPELVVPYIIRIRRPKS